MVPNGSRHTAADLDTKVLHHRRRWVVGVERLRSEDDGRVCDTAADVASVVTGKFEVAAAPERVSTDRVRLLNLHTTRLRGQQRRSRFVIYATQVGGVARWLGRMSLVVGHFPCPVPDLRLTGDHFVGKLSAIGQPTIGQLSLDHSGLGK